MPQDPTDSHPQVAPRPTRRAAPRRRIRRPAAGRLTAALLAAAALLAPALAPTSHAMPTLDTGAAFRAADAQPVSPAAPSGAPLHAAQMAAPGAAQVAAAPADVVSLDCLPPQATTMSLDAGSGAGLPFGRLELELSTSSDWSTLTIGPPDSILAMSLADTTMPAPGPTLDPSRVLLRQPADSAAAGSSVSATVRLAVSAGAQQPLTFHVGKGALNSTTLRVYRVEDGQRSLLREVSGAGAAPLDLSLSPTELAAAAPLRLQCADQPAPRQRLALAFYFSWFHLGTFDRLGGAPYQPLQPYASSDRAVIARQIQQAKSAGLDAFIGDWYGPGNYIDENFATLMDVAAENDFKVGILLDRTFNDQPRTAEDAYTELHYALTTYGDSPALLRVDGKPVVMIYLTKLSSTAEWRDVFSRLRAEGLDATFIGMGLDPGALSVFDGWHEYNIADRDLAQLDSQYRQFSRYYPLVEPTAAPKLWVATVEPGFDDRAIPGRKGEHFTDRQDGAFYRQTWEAALAEDPDWVVVTTWNDWGEQTAVEPSRQYGNLYLDLTREYIARWKAQASPATIAATTGGD